ncbi:MAG: adenylate/guanylate cyclase domain-containing protein, partial [Rhodoferax sp.]
MGRIEKVRLLKGQGLSMAEIAAELAQVSPLAAIPSPAPLQAAALPPSAPIAQAQATTAPLAPDAPKLRKGDLGGMLGGVLTIDDIEHPAYMVNYNFQLTWFNELARQEILGFDTPPPGSESRNVFLMPLNETAGGSPMRRRELMELYIILAKARLPKARMLGIVKNMDREVIALVDELYDESESPTGQLVVELPCPLHDHRGQIEPWKVYGIYFREGILVIHTRVGAVDQSLLEFIARRDVVVRNLLRKQLPVLTPLAVLLADLQGSVKICSELPPDEYFELINEIWSAMGPIFRKYYGTYGKHVGDGMVYYFFPQPDSNYIFNSLACANEIKQEMRRISKRWQLRKNWLNELYLNIG